MIYKALIVLAMLFSTQSLQAEIYDTYLPAAKASLEEKKTLIVVIGAEDW